MKVKTTFIDRNKLRSQFANAIANFDELYSKSDIILSENLYPMRKDSYHFVGQMLKKLHKPTRVEHLLSSQIFEAVYRSEVTSAGAGHIALLFSLEMAKNLNRSAINLNNETELLSAYARYMEKFRNQLIINSEIAKPNDVKKTIKEICDDDHILSEVIWQSIQLGGLEGRIFVEDGRQKNYIIEHKEGYSFHLKSYKWMLENNSWERNECKVMVIDGLVEKISELDQVLSKAFELKQPMAIIALGFSEEVAATIKANMDRGLLDVQLIRVPTDVESLNVINDISVVVGSLPVSSMKGDLITFVKWEEIPTVNKIKLYPEQCVIENSKTRAAVSEQVKMILEKRDENRLYEDVQNLLDKRIRSLVSNAVTIFLQEMTVLENDAQRVKIDSALRQCKTILNYGTTDFYKAVNGLPVTKELDKIIYKSLKAVKIKSRCPPTLSALMGCMLAGKAILMFYCASGLVEIMS